MAPVVSNFVPEAGERDAVQFLQKWNTKVEMPWVDGGFLTLSQMVIQHDETTKNWIEFCVFCVSENGGCNFMAILMGKMLLSRWICFFSQIFQRYKTICYLAGCSTSSSSFSHEKWWSARGKWSQPIHWPPNSDGKEKSIKCVSPLVPKYQSIYHQWDFQDPKMEVR